MAVAEQSVGGQIVSRETWAALTELEGLVRRWTPAINLVSRNSISDLWARHISDSAQLFQFRPPGARHWADLGSGGGFPGLVIAVMARDECPEMKVSLVESDKRKAAFLRQAGQALGIDVAVHCDRIESLPPLQADVISARALAPLAELLSYAQRHLRPDGVAIFPKGMRHQEEVTEARGDWSFEAETHASHSDPNAAIVIIRKIERA